MALVRHLFGTRWAMTSDLRRRMTHTCATPHTKHHVDNCALVHFRDVCRVWVCGFFVCQLGLYTCLYGARAALLCQVRDTQASGTTQRDPFLPSQFAIYIYIYSHAAHFTCSPLLYASWLSCMEYIYIYIYNTHAQRVTRNVVDNVFAVVWASFRSSSRSAQIASWRRSFCGENKRFVKRRSKAHPHPHTYSPSMIYCMPLCQTTGHQRSSTRMPRHTTSRLRQETTSPSPPSPETNVCSAFLDGATGNISLAALVSLPRAHCKSFTGEFDGRSRAVTGWMNRCVCAVWCKHIYVA